MPRPNGYQSLHTSVVGDRGMPFEVQIRTRGNAPDRRGRASPRTGNTRKGRVGAERDEQYFQWLRQLLEWQQDVRDPQEFLQNLRIELYPEEVYIFTPKGEVKSLPQRGDAGRFRVLRPHRRRASVRRAPGSTAGWCRFAPGCQRRHRRDPHAARAQAKPRLAQFRRDLARAEQDPALHPCRGEDAAASSWAGGCSRRKCAGSPWTRRAVNDEALAKIVERVRRAEGR